MADERKLTKKEKKELRRTEWQEKAKKEERSAQIKKFSIWGGTLALIVLSVIGLIWLVSSSSPSSDSGGEKIDVAEISSKDMATGDKSAKVTLIEYGDFQCPACAAYHPLVKQLMAEEGDKLRFVYRFFPLENIHPNAVEADQAAYAASKQDKFWEMYDLLYTNQDEWSNLPDPLSTFKEYAKDINLDMNKFEEVYKSDEAKNYIQDFVKLGVSEGINATPTFVLNGVKIVNPQNYAEFKKLVDDEFNKE